MVSPFSNCWRLLHTSCSPTDPQWTVSRCVAPNLQLDPKLGMISNDDIFAVEKTRNRQETIWSKSSFLCRLIKGLNQSILSGVIPSYTILYHGIPWYTNNFGTSNPPNSHTYPWSLPHPGSPARIGPQPTLESTKCLCPVGFLLWSMDRKWSREGESQRFLESRSIKAAV